MIGLYLSLRAFFFFLYYFLSSTSPLFQGGEKKKKSLRCVSKPPCEVKFIDDIELNMYLFSVLWKL